MFRFINMRTYPDHTESQVCEWTDCINIQCELRLCHDCENGDQVRGPDSAVWAGEVRYLKRETKVVNNVIY